jgi:hypothetical protein
VGGAAVIRHMLRKAAEARCPIGTGRNNTASIPREVLPQSDLVPGPGIPPLAPGIRLEADEQLSSEWHRQRAQSAIGGTIGYAFEGPDTAHICLPRAEMKQRWGPANRL